MASHRERVPKEDGEDRFEDVPSEEEPEAPVDDATAALERLPKLKLCAKGSSKGDKQRNKNKEEKKHKEERCNQVHNQAASRRMEMMMSTMLKGYQRGHSSLIPRDHIRVYPLIMIP